MQKSYFLQLRRFFSIGLLTAILVTLSLFVHAPARAAGGDCFDITGRGTEVLTPLPPAPGGVANSGYMDFDTLVPALQYEACMRDPGTSTLGPFEVKGWVWDTNLGWISLYCADEDSNAATPMTNLGAPCGDGVGDIAYGVMMDGTGGPLPGRLSGYAWGDNVGWISFNCSDLGTCGTSNFYTEAETTDPLCMGDVYSNVPACTVTPVRPANSVYGWADSVGWFDLTGVNFPWIDILSIGIDATLEVVPAATGFKADAPTANGVDTYKLVLHMRRSFDGAVLPVPTNYVLSASMSWLDTVDLDQTDIAHGDYSACTGGACGAVNKPASAALTDMTKYGADPLYPDAVVATVTSKAPTSDMNGYDENGDGVVDFSFENFVLGNPNAPSDVTSNELQLQDAQLSAIHTPTGICAFGGGLTCLKKPVLSAVESLPFRPAVDITQFDDAINKFFIAAQNTVANSIQTTITCSLADCSSTSINFITGVGGDFIYGYDAAQDGPDPSDLTNFSLAPIPSGTNDFNSPAGLQLTPVCTAPPDAEGNVSCPPSAQDAYVYGTVHYNLGGSAVSYFTNKLPRVIGTLVVNPVADIKGNVYSTGVTNPQTGQQVRSLGELSTNILRDTLNRNISNIVAGVSIPTGNATLSGWTAASGFTVAPSAAFRPLLSDLVGGVPKAYYVTGNLTIDSGATALSWTGERTLIVQGGNVFIKSDIYNLPGASKPKLGIIVLKDLTDSNPATQGGNVYIAPNVKNIQANIYADGSIFSYDPAEGLTAAGLPKFASEADRFDKLKNQLFFQGSLASLNTIGGAVKSPPILGDGTPVSAVEGVYGENPTGRSAARLYDLNFLRYYGLVFERDLNGNAVDQQGDAPGSPNYLELTNVNDGGDLVKIEGGDPAAGRTASKDFSAVYVEFDPPTPNLPGFNVTSGVEVKIRP